MFDSCCYSWLEVMGATCVAGGSFVVALVLVKVLMRDGGVNHANEGSSDGRYGAR